MKRYEKIISMRRISQAYHLLMGETVAINNVDHTIVSVPRNNVMGVCDLCDYQGGCPFEVRQVCSFLFPTESTNFTLAPSQKSNKITL